MKKKWPFHIYSSELFYRSLYILFGLVFILHIFNVKYETLFFIKIFPIILLNKKLIVTRVLELIELWWFLILSNSLLFLWPFFNIQVTYFFKSSFYEYQFYFIKTILRSVLKNWFVLFIIYYFIVLPHVLKLLLLWDKADIIFNNFYVIDIQPNVFNYVKWISQFYYFFNFIILFCTNYFVILIFFQGPYSIFTRARNHKKIFLFLFTILIFFFLPPNLFFNSYMFLSIFMLLELIFFSFGFNLIYKLKYKT